MGRHGVPPLADRVFQLKGPDVDRAWESAFGAARGRRPTGQRAQGCRPAASSNNKFTPLTGSCDPENPGSDSPGGPGGPGSDAHHTGSKAPNAHGSSLGTGNPDSSGGVNTSGTPMDTNDDDHLDTSIQQLPIDAEPLRQHIDRQQAAELAKRQVKEDEEICCQLLEELQRA